MKSQSVLVGRVHGSEENKIGITQTRCRKIRMFFLSEVQGFVFTGLLVLRKVLIQYWIGFDANVGWSFGYRALCIVLRKRRKVTQLHEIIIV